jgi:hypothetical protein
MKIQERSKKSVVNFPQNILNYAFTSSSGMNELETFLFD